MADSDGSAPETLATVPNDTSGLLKRLKKLAVGAKVKCCYECTCVETRSIAAGDDARFARVTPVCASRSTAVSTAKWCTGYLVPRHALPTQ